MKNRASSKGFTLIEIMIALAILSVGLVSIYTAQGNSLRASGNAERMETAALLARQIMTQKLLDVEKKMQKGVFPADKEEDTGEFDAPFDEYRWEYSARKVEIPIGGGGGQQAAEGGGQGAEANQAPESAQNSLAQMVKKKLSDTIREINVRIIWEELGEEQSIRVTTHVAKLSN
jgi:prepilin-type N-terminal cleavage/methylation domain-containing protein